ncbi:UDP-N-acetylglucosamine 2-epimerase [Candidatus Syntrophocurvum alkaliphilum]|uniref:UDP-N-acetylglucosamine 2-epimerase n=1 Tax=Candidatus Syntrophocurvum alkaliphilum TaxID=2293317 RepID=A0A6I6DJ73_9FIRM|nr:UDP-N-acetylglucosamine 2-epimerase (non-hydrolyzing) [Candidatus Syntrophocurvum alkaliphilum]QGU00164.1 UDP-N-acetylglucosamine 2-epimerase [Candidatus Syntrophocurvum alkaliphilum]
MKIMTILGTRPEIIRLSKIIPLLDKYYNHVLVNTGQNFDPKLNDIFFNELGIRQVNYSLDCNYKKGIEQISYILTSCENILSLEKPDRILILGDTNSALSAIVAKRMGIPVFHMEAGNRCYDDRVPEEINRRIVDHCSDILLPYTERSRANLLSEGIPSHKIFVTGNPIKEVLDYYAVDIQASKVLEKLNIKAKPYFLATLHRAENVDVSYRLNKFMEALHLLNLEYEIPVICSLHPRTRSKLNKNNQILNRNEITFIEPIGLFDFIKLQQNAHCVLSDSGTVQEECCIMGIPNVTLRDVTERPETVENGSCIISGCEPADIINAVEIAVNLENTWSIPAEYTNNQVSTSVVKIISSALPQ